jgi:hypothetical protein
MTHGQPAAQVPAHSAVTSFRSGGEDSFHATAGGGAGPFLSLAIAGALLVGLSYWWIDFENLATPRDEPLRAVGGVVLLILAFIAVLSLLSLSRSLVGRRPWLDATLRLAPERILVGGMLRGEVELSTPVAQDESVIIVLTCSAFDLGSDSSTARFRWGTEQVVDGAACLQGSPTRVPFAILIPPGAPPSGTYRMGIHSCQVTWYVHASIEPRRASEFRFSVTVGSTSPPTSILDGLPPEFPMGPGTPGRPACSRILKTLPGGGGVDYRLPRPVAWASGLWWVALTTPLWLILPWMAWRDERDWPGNLFWMLLILAVVNVLPLAALLGTNGIHVDANGVVVTRRSFRRKRFHIRDLRGAVTTWGAHGALPDNCRRAVALDRLSGGPVRVATFISVAEARWLAADITAAIAEAKSVRDRQAAAVDVTRP